MKKFIDLERIFCAEKVSRFSFYAFALEINSFHEDFFSERIISFLRLVSWHGTSECRKEGKVGSWNFDVLWVDSKVK